MADNNTLGDNLAANLSRVGANLSQCPHPNKLRFSTMDAVIRKAQRVGNMAIYKCRCGDWHMTTIPDADVLRP